MAQTTKRKKPNETKTQTQLLKIEGLSKTYKLGEVEVPALSGIDLSIQAKEFTAFSGPSGSGKTTLLNCIGCIDKGEQGKIIFQGQDIMQKTAVELAFIRREFFGFIFQSYNLMPVLTVAENIELPLKLLKKFSDEEIFEKVNAILKEVGLDGYQNRKPLELSGGQQQRVSIARALVKNPRVILADEPTANLDSKTGREIIDLMKELNEREGTTFLFSTHDPMVMNHAQRLITITDGKISADKKSKGR